MNPIPYHIPHCGSLNPIHDNQIDWDPRGILWIWEEPKPNAHYVMGVDPTRGIVGWDRTLRKEDDSKTDNGAIEVIRCGKNGNPDVQVAEYAAPVDAEDLGDMANAIGRMYGGDNEDGQALAIIEVWPGPGEPCQRRMISEYGYTHLYVPIRFANTLSPEQGRNTVGWVSNQRSRRDLWIRGIKHLIQRKVRINSEWLIEEMCDCQSDDWMVTETARARYGKHDDRVVALMLAIYAAHDWSWEYETEKVEVTPGSGTNWQASDMSYDEMMSAWDDRFSELSG